MHRSVINHLRHAPSFMRSTAGLVLLAFIMLILQPTVVAAKTNNLIPKAVAQTASPAACAKESASTPDVLEKIQEQLGKLQSKLDKGEDDGTERAALQNQKQLLKQFDVRERQNFDEIKRHLEDKKLPTELLKRHQEAVDKYQANYTALMAELDSLENEDDKGNRRNHAEAALKQLKSQSTQKRAKPFDPNHLPFRETEHKTRAPKENQKELEQLIHAQQEPVMLAATTLQPGMLASAAVNLAPTPEDIAETEDVRITDAIRAQASALHNNPVEIWNWVSNNIEFLPTYGAIQDADATLQTLRGNAFDTANLLIALLRASDIPARYVVGTIQISAEQLMNWVGGVSTPEAAQELISKGGIPISALVSGGKITAFRMEHVWVSAFVDYMPSRGAKNKVGDTWVPLDASFKQYTYQQGINFNTISPFDNQAFLDQIKQGATINDTEGWVQNINPYLVKDLINDYQSQVYNAVISQKPNISIDEVIGKKAIITHNHPLLAGSLPYQIITLGSPFAKLPDSLRWKVQLQYFFSDLDLVTDTPALSTEISLPKLANRKFGISYLPASDVDAQMLADAQQSGATSLPIYLISVKPDIQIDGQSLMQGASSLMGQAVYWKLVFQGPGLEPFAADYQVNTGDEIVFGIDSAGFDIKNSQTLFSKYQTPTASNNLQLTSLAFWSQYDLYNQLIAQSAGLSVVRLPSAGLFASRLTVKKLFGMPRSGFYLGRSMDVQQSMLSFSGGDQALRATVMRESGIHASYLEGFTFDQLFEHAQGTGISATRLIQRAMAEGAKVYRIDQSNIATVLPQLTLNDTVKSDISNAVAAGKYSIVPERGINSGSSQWTGYYIIDPVTGAGAYLINGGYNGGSEGETCETAHSTQAVVYTVASIALSIFAAFNIYARAGEVLQWALVRGTGVAAGAVISANAQGSSSSVIPAYLKRKSLELWNKMFARTRGSWPINGQYPGDGLTRYGYCSEQEHNDLEVIKAYYCEKVIECDYKKMNGDCKIIEEATNTWQDCINARLDVMATCFNGGDSGHWEYIANLLDKLRGCLSCLETAQKNQCKPIK